MGLLGAATAHRLGRVVGAYALFSLVELAIWMVVVLWAFERGGAGLAAMATVVQLVPATVLSPVLAGLGDRGDRGLALLLAHTGTALAVGATGAALLAGAGPVAVVGASTVATTLICVVRPLHFAVLPQLAEAPAALVRGNVRSAGAEALARFAGPALAGVGVAGIGAGPIMLGCAAVSVVATLLCVRLRAGATGAGPGSSSRLREATEGLRVVARDRAALTLLLVLATRFVIAGAIDVLGTAFATDALGLDGAAAGLVVGSSGLGMVLGTVVASRTGHRQRLAVVVLGGCALQGLAAAAIGVAGGLLPAVLAMAACGVGMTVMLVGGRTLLQRTTDDTLLARVFAVQESVSLVGLGIGIGVAPLLISAVGARAAFVPLGLVCAAVALLARRAVRRLDARSVVPAPQTDLLRAVPFLAGLPAWELERLAAAARLVEASPAQAIVLQGEPGEDFYVVATGTLGVEVEGAATGRTLGPGDGFGEIALLRAVPRTATVRALTAATLYAVSSEAFLGAVTGSPDGHRVAQEVASAHLERDAVRARD